MASNAAINAFRIAYANPSQAQENTAFLSRADEYELLWAWYTGSAFDPTEGMWTAYRARYGLYRYTRMVRNLTTRLVEFYAAQIYPGVLADDGVNLPEGFPNAMPFPKDIDPALAAAIAQIWQWSNYQSLKSVHVRWAAATGNVLMTVVDDLERGKVFIQPVWPGHLADLQLDPTGNVIRYALEYPITEEVNPGGPYVRPLAQRHIYRLAVDKTMIRYYRDGTPWDYGSGAEIENPYGFVPAVWIKHADAGGMYGQPAIAGSLSKLNEVNSLSSQINDRIHRAVEPSIIIAGTGKIARLFDKDGNNTKRGATEDFNDPQAGRESIKTFSGPADTKVLPILADLNLADALKAVDGLLGEIEADNPETTFWAKLREMSQISGRAAQMLSGDVISRTLEAQALYDRGNKALLQMAVAIAGYRQSEGHSGWAISNRQRDKFKALDLASYERGDLDFSLLPRPLVEPSRLEQAQESLIFWQAGKAAEDAGVGIETYLEEAGWSPDRIDEITQRNEDKATAAQKLAETQLALKTAVVPPPDPTADPMMMNQPQKQGDITTNG
jgi:hypothetical protein